MSTSMAHSLHLTPVQRLRLLVQADRLDLLVVVAYSIVIGLLMLAVPIATQSLINTVAFGTVLQPLIVLSLFVLAALLAASTLQTLRQWLVEVIQRRLFVRMAGEVGDRILRAESSSFDRVHGPELVNRFLDVVTVQKSVAVLLIDGLSISMQTTVGLLLLAVYHPLLLVFDVVLFAMILLVLFFMGRGAVRTSIEESQAKYDMVAWLEELARHRAAFRSASGSRFAWARIDHLAANYVQTRSTHFRIQMRQIIGSFGLQSFALSALLGFGGWLVMQGQLTLGQLIAAELIVGTVVGGFTKLNKSLESYYDLAAAVDKLGYLQDLPTERTFGHPVPESSEAAALSLHGVWFRYDGGSNLLRDASLQISAGDKVAIYGGLGSGTSSLLDILSSLRTPSSGHLEWNGIDYRDLDLRCLRSEIALVRGVEIFSGTILENLTVGASADSNEIRTAMEHTGLQAVVSALPLGLQTPLATDGAPLTQSQATRLMVARALVSRPRVILLDKTLDTIEDLQPNGPLLRTLFADNSPWTLVLTSDRAHIRARCKHMYCLSEGALQRTHADSPDNSGGRA